MSSKSILNIGGGKILPLDYKPSDFLVQVDECYATSNPIESIEASHMIFKENRTDGGIHWCSNDVFQFMGQYRYMFDQVSAYRILEHIEKPQIQGFIYLISTCLKTGGILDIIVPNFEVLADMILTETVGEKVRHRDWEQHDTLLTYELLNEPSMPHASIWTPNRIKYFIELEERFKLKDIDPTFVFDGRDIYIRAIFERI